VFAALPAIQLVGPGGIWSRGSGVRATSKSHGTVFGDARVAEYLALWMASNDLYRVRSTCCSPTAAYAHFERRRKTLRGSTVSTRPVTDGCNYFFALSIARIAKISILSHQYKGDA